jgi:hypothetical protein
MSDEKKGVFIKMDPTIHDEMKKYCSENNISVTRLIETAVDKYVKSKIIEKNTH